MRLVLGVWRHWLEGSAQPFLVWMDHKNLEYIRSAKRLSSRQASWALFFGRFNFTLSWDSSKNVKPNTLSHQFGAPEGELTAATIHTVPYALRPEVLQRGHESRLVCHPGIRRTLFAICQRFWRPTLAADVREFVLACHTCAQCKPVDHPPDGLLHPLPVPSCPWSHITLDFVSGLPPSKGNTVVLMVVDRFSKAVHFIPLPKLPSARETTQLMVDHAFRLHGLPVDVVSDRGPQFASRFWKEFCRQIRASASLFSGFHPQTKGQCERANQDLERMLHYLTSNNHVHGANSSLG